MNQDKNQCSGCAVDQGTHKPAEALRPIGGHQQEALRLAHKYEAEGFVGEHKFAQNKWCRDAATELLHQHARIEELMTKEVHTDSERRNAIAKLLGLGDANFAWSYLHDQIKDLVKCEKELIALRKQAAPDERKAFDAANLRDYFGGPLSYREKDIAFMAWQARAELAASPAADAPMVDMTPPATSRDRWMYEQGRLAERDARTPGSVAAAAPVVLPEPDAYLYTSGNHRGVSLEWRGQSDMAEGTERHALYTEQQVRALLAGVLAAAAQGMNAPNEWEDIRTLPTCDDLIWLYCQDSNTIDGPIAPEPNLEEYGWTHWAYANAPSTAWIDAAQAKQGGA